MGDIVLAYSCFKASSCIEDMYQARLSKRGGGVIMTIDRVHVHVLGNFDQVHFLYHKVAHSHLSHKHSGVGLFTY